MIVGIMILQSLIMIAIGWHFSKMPWKDFLFLLTMILLLELIAYADGKGVFIQ